MTPDSHFSVRRQLGPLMALLIALLALLIAQPGSASAGAGTITTTGGSDAPPVLMGGLTVDGATVSTPGEEQRTLDANQATAFMQTWFSYSITVNPANEDPPDDLTVSELHVAVTSSGTPSEFLIFYASDGVDAWVGAPAPAPGDPDKWIRSPRPRRTIAGFEGRLEPIRAEVPDTTTTTTVGGTAGSADNDDETESDGRSWQIAVVAVVVLFGGGAIALRLGRRNRFPRKG